MVISQPRCLSPTLIVYATKLILFNKNTGSLIPITVILSQGTKQITAHYGTHKKGELWYVQFEDGEAFWEFSTSCWCLREWHHEWVLSLFQRIDHSLNVLTTQHIGIEERVNKKTQILRIVADSMLSTVLSSYSSTMRKKTPSAGQAKRESPTRLCDCPEVARAAGYI